MNIFWSCKNLMVTQKATKNLLTHCPNRKHFLSSIFERIFLDYKVWDQISRNFLYHCLKLCKNLMATQKATRYPSAECRSIKSKWKTLAFAKKTFRKLWGPKHTPNKPTFNLSALIKKLCPTFPRKEVNLALEIYSRNLACPLLLQ